MSDLLPLGTRVTFDAVNVLRRLHVPLSEEDARMARVMGYRDQRRKAWLTGREVWPTMDIAPIPATGIIVGARSLANGLTEYEPEYGTVFMPRERVPVYLVATGLHDGLVRVRREHVTPEAVSVEPRDPMTLADAVREQASGPLAPSSPPV